MYVILAAAGQMMLYDSGEKAFLGNSQDSKSFRAPEIMEKTHQMQMRAFIFLYEAHAHEYIHLCTCRSSSVSAFRRMKEYGNYVFRIS